MRYHNFTYEKIYFLLVIDTTLLSVVYCFGVPTFSVLRGEPEMRETVFISYFLIASILYAVAALVPELSHGIDPMFKLVIIGLFLNSEPNRSQIMMAIIDKVSKKDKK